MSSSDAFDVIVIGAGVIGLSVGRQLAAAGHATLVIDRNARIGEETSSRNSCVVHSGIYYPTGSLKARLCVSGRERLYEYCEARGIAHRRCGKLIVAQHDQVSALEALHAKGRENGVDALQWLERAQARDLEPLVTCAAGVLSPSTGIVDVHELMVSLLGDLESHGGTLALRTEATVICPGSGGFELTVRSGGDEYVIASRHVVNSAGLHAVSLTRQIVGYPADQIPTAYLAKGSYFSCNRSPFHRLVYPMPSEAGLGIHATLDLGGCVRFGPDVEWVDSIDYAVDSQRSASFYESIREYWPGLPAGGLLPAYSGIRPKIAGPGDRAADFVIAGPREHGIDGLVNLLGIESPGLTAALSIAEHVSRLLELA